MNTGRVVLAGIVGGFVMFVWGALCHMALPLGEMGVSSLPAEETILPVVQEAVLERGFYFFPAFDSTDESEAAMNQWAEKLREGPRGVLIYDPSGGEPMDVAQLGAEFVSNVLAAIVAAIVLALVAAQAGTRILLAGGLGLLSWLSIDVSYWTWYRFPDLFAVAALIQQVVGWLLTGIAIVLILGRRPAPTGSASAPA